MKGGTDPEMERMGADVWGTENKSSFLKMLIWRFILLMQVPLLNT